MSDSQQQGARVNQTKILIVEDHEDSFRALEKCIGVFFADKNLVLLHASDLATALKMNRVRGPFAVCVLDLRLPDSDLENTLKYITEFGCPVFVVSGSGSSATRKAALNYGARDYLGKPLVPEMFVEKLSRLLQLDNPGADYSRVARRAQQSIAQKTILADRSGKTLWDRFGPWGASIAAVLMFVGGHIEGAWNKSLDKAATQQARADNFNALQSDVKLLQDRQTGTDQRLEKLAGENQHYQIRMAKDMARLLEKNGLQPAGD